MSIRKFRAARVNTTTGNIYVGQLGDMFYDESTGLLKISDGHTPGGHYVSVLPATTTLVGGIKAGPGANVSVDGTLTINTAGLPLSIGDLSIIQANISTVNPNENLNLVTNGTGAINVVGNLHVHTTAQNWFADGAGATPILLADNSGNVTVNGNLITNGGTFFIGNVTQIGNLTVTGPAQYVGPQTTTGDSKFTGNITANGSVTFNGSTTFIGNVTEVGNLTITGKAINNGPSVFNGSMTIAGDTSIVGNVTMTGNSSITGNTTVTGTTTVTGNTYVTGQSTTITGNTYLSGNSFVIGTTTVTGNITVTGNSVQTGQSIFVVSTPSATQGAVEITGDTNKLWQTPVNTGVMLQVTGQPSSISRIYNDAQANYAIYAGRRFEGTIASPTGVQGNIDIVRFAGGVYTTAGWSNIGPARMSIVTNEIQTATNQGGRIEFWTTANSAGPAYSTVSRTATVDPALGVTATGFVTAGNVTAANVNATTVYANVVGSSSNLKMDGTSIGTFLAGKFTIAVNVGKNSLTTLTQTITGLTTSHKVVITPATAMPDNSTFFGAAWASGTNTLSIQFATGGGGVNSSFDINYFAWV